MCIWCYCVNIADVIFTLLTENCSNSKGLLALPLFWNYLFSKRKLDVCIREQT